jgi:hypothetical protein
MVNIFINFCREAISKLDRSPLKWQYLTWTTLLTITFFLLPLSASLACEGSGDIEHYPNNSMPENPNKLGPLLKLRLSEEDPDSLDRLNLLVQVTASLTNERVEQMNEIGSEIRTTAGDVLTLTLPINQVGALAEFDFVVYMELSSPLSPEN